MAEHALTSWNVLERDSDPTKYEGGLPWVQLAWRYKENTLASAAPIIHTDNDYKRIVL